MWNQAVVLTKPTLLHRHNINYVNRNNIKGLRPMIVDAAWYHELGNAQMPFQIVNME